MSALDRSTIYCCNYSLPLSLSLSLSLNLHGTHCANGGASHNSVGMAYSKILMGKECFKSENFPPQVEYIRYSMAKDHLVVDLESFFLTINESYLG